MAFSVNMGVPQGRDPMDDQAFRAQIAAWNRQDKSDEYTFFDMEVEGPKPSSGPRARFKVKLKYALDGCYLFAVYADNPDLHKLDRDEWDLIARQALEKFTGVRGLHVKLGPRPEDHNRYNHMVEFDKPVEQKPETAALLAQQHEAREKERKRVEMLRELGMAPDGTPLPYQPVQR